MRHAGLFLCPGLPLFRDPTPRDEDLVVKEPSPFAAVMRELNGDDEEQRPAIDINAEAATENTDTETETEPEPEPEYEQ